MEPSAGTIMAFVSVANFLTTIGTLIYAHSVKRRQATQEQIAKVRTDVGQDMKSIDNRVGLHAERILRLEESFEGLPSSKAFHELAIAVERTNGDLRAATARLAGWEGATRRIESVLNRQEEFLLNLGRGK